MTTLMSAVRKNDMATFMKLVTGASSKHVDDSLQIAARDDHDSFVPLLLAHPNLTQKGFETGFNCAIHNRKKELMKLFIEDNRATTDMIVDLLLR